MEPEELLNADGGGPPPGADELRAIVSKVRRRWPGLIVGPLVAALGAGLGIGFAVSNHSSSHAQNVSTETPSASGSNSEAPQTGAASTGGSNSSAIVSPFGGTQRLNPLFNRTVGDIEIRGYSILTPKSEMPAALPQCSVAFGPRFQVEVSTLKAVGTTTAGSFYYGPRAPASGAIFDIEYSVFGVAEGEPVLVVTAQVGKNVASVRETGFNSGATDDMAPIQGFVALAGPTTAPSTSVPQKTVKLGTITALDASGKILATRTVTNTTFGWYGGPLTGSVSGNASGTAFACPAQVRPCPAIAPAYAGVSVPGATCGFGSSTPCTTIGGATGAALPQFACPLKPGLGAPSGSGGSGSAGSGSSGSGSAGSGSTGSGAVTHP